LDDFKDENNPLEYLEKSQNDFIIQFR